MTKKILLILGYTEDLNELLQKSVVFNKQEPVTTNSNNTAFYQSYGQQLPENNVRRYTNSNNNYNRDQSNDYHKRSASMKPKFLGEG